MYSDDRIKELLSRPIKDSEIIDEKMQEAYEKIREMAEEKEIIMNRRKKKKRFYYSLTGVAALFTVILLVEVSNPVWAENLPIVGGIFEKIQEIWNYGKVLEEDIIDLETEKMEMEIFPYQLTTDEVTLKLTEYYATKEAVFLGIRIESEKAFSEVYGLDYELKEDDFFIQLFANAEVSFCEETLNAGHGYVEGMLVDAYTYEGVLRMDFVSEDVPKQFELDFIVSNGYSYFKNENGTELLHKTFRMEGVIENIPIQIVSETGTVIEINEVNELGVGVESVKISPLELIVYPINKNPKEELLTFEVVLDADGERLDDGNHDGIGEERVFAIDGRDISTITIYSCEWDTYMNIKGLALEEDGTLFQNALEENALYKKVVDTGIGKE